MNNNNNGQTSVEYSLLLAVMMVVGLAFFRQLNDYLVANPNSLVGRVQSSFEELVGSDNNGVSLQYKRFTIRR